MKSLTEELWMEVPQRRAIISLHREVERLVSRPELLEYEIDLRSETPVRETDVVQPFWLVMVMVPASS